MLWALMLVTGLTSGLQGPTDEGGVITLGRLRSVDGSIRATIDEGCRRSPTFAALVNDLERSSFIVYVEQVSTLRDGMRGALLHGGAGPQYLRVLLKRGMSLDRRVVVLAHELQHAVEVVQAGIAADAVEMDALFRRIGDERSPDGQRQRYETAAALRVTNAVVADLRAHRGAGQGVGHCRAAAGIGQRPDAEAAEPNPIIAIRGGRSERSGGPWLCPGGGTRDRDVSASGRHAAMNHRRDDEVG